MQARATPQAKTGQGPGRPSVRISTGWFGDNQNPADPKQGSAALGRYGRRPETPGHDHVVLPPVSGIPTDLLGSAQKGNRTAFQSQAGDGLLDETGAARSAVEEHPARVRKSAGENQPGNPTTGPQVESPDVTTWPTWPTTRPRRHDHRRRDRRSDREGMVQLSCDGTGTQKPTALALGQYVDELTPPTCCQDRPDNLTIARVPRVVGRSGRQTGLRPRFPAERSRPGDGAPRPLNWSSRRRWR